MTSQTRHATAVISQNEKDAVLSDCDSDGSDMDYDGETGHLPARLLNAHAELMQTDQYRNNHISDDDLPLTTTLAPPLSTAGSKEPKASTCQKVCSKEPRAMLQVVKNKDRVFKQSDRPATTVIPKHIVYSPNAAEFLKQSHPTPVYVFLLMYPPTLRETTREMSNLYSTQTKDKQLYLRMDELLTFYGILITSGYSSVPRRHMYLSLDSEVHNESISDAMRRNRFDEIMASLHVVDNTKITDDYFLKLGSSSQSSISHIKSCYFRNGCQ